MTLCYLLPLYGTLLPTYYALNTTYLWHLKFYLPTPLEKLPFYGEFTLDPVVSFFRSGMHQRRDVKISISLQKCNCLTKMHAANAVM